MAFNSSLDKVLIGWTVGDGLEIKVCIYNGGDKKLQIGPRTYEKKDGSTGFRKAGRMSFDEVKELYALEHDIALAMK